MVFGKKIVIKELKMVERNPELELLYQILMGNYEKISDVYIDEEFVKDLLKY